MVDGNDTLKKELCEKHFDDQYAYVGDTVFEFAKRCSKDEQELRKNYETLAHLALDAVKKHENQVSAIAKSSPIYSMGVIQRD